MVLQKTRAGAVGLALILALAGCSDDGGTSGGGTSGSDKKTVAAPLTTAQVAQAIPSELAAPAGWKGRTPRVQEGGELREFCEMKGAWSCAGLTTAATTQHFKPDSGGEIDVDFELLAYDSVDSAKVGMKTVVARHHEKNAAAIKPLTIDVGADETDAYTKEESTVAALRVGTVVALLYGHSLPKDQDLRSFATMQVERITSVAAGKNPDA
ncbi:hypothetical protein [Streptomyces sp. enrichment culture]|uniref:hypothetical protein n=1 Tax=Streptomyces sp. enrichment culture TaxID=1795815 RepID=UPI003F57C045